MGKSMKYQRDFLKANRITQRQFELKYIQFMESNPGEQAYRDFAKKWSITIYPGLGNPKTEAVLSVGVAAIKVMAKTDNEADEAIAEILEGVK